MEITISLAQAVFYVALFFTIFGGILGLLGVWIKDFWNSDLAIRLFFTDCIFAATSFVVAIIIKYINT